MQEGFEAINSALSSVDRKQVKGIGISGQQHGFVPVDSKGQVRLFFSTCICQSLYNLLKRSTVHTIEAE